MVTRTVASMLVVLLTAQQGTARLGESLEALKDRHGYPSVELKARSTYGWPIDEEKRVFLNVICDGNGKSIAEQIRAYEGSLTEKQVLAFFSDQLGHEVTSEDLEYKRDVSFSGIRLYFPELTPVYFDEETGLLCMWERGNKNTASVFSKTGINHRVLLDPMSEDRA